MTITHCPTCGRTCADPSSIAHVELGEKPSPRMCYASQFPDDLCKAPKVAKPPAPATSPSTKAAFRRHCQLAFDQGRPAMLYAPFCPTGALRQVLKVRSADIIFLITAGAKAGTESYLSIGKDDTITNDGEVWTITATCIVLTYVFQE
jgi:hypothetical protein